MGPMRFERMTSRLSAGFQDEETTRIDKRGEIYEDLPTERRKQPLQANFTERTFNLADLDDYIKNALPNARPKTLEGVSSAWKQFLGFGEEISRKTGGRKKIVELEAKITFDTINAYNADQNTKKSGTYLGYVRTMLDYFAKKRGDAVLHSWAETLKYAPNTTKRLFAVEGEKASITAEDVAGDIQIYYNHILRDDLGTGASSKKSAYRNMVNLLFGITTGARVEEMNRLTWKEINQGLKEGSFIIPAAYTKTNAERVIPIHPAIKPYLETLKELYPDSPFSTDKFRDIRRTMNANLHLNQTRNYAVKYWRRYGIDEKIRIAIMGHDEGAIKKEIDQEVRTGISETYRKYGPKEITEHYQETVGSKFKPIPKGTDIKKVIQNLRQFMKN